MPKVEIKPTAILKLRPRTTFAVTGGGTVIGALTDDSANTYCKVAAANKPVDIRLGALAPGAGERIVSICPRIRSAQPGTKKPSVALGAQLTEIVGGASLPSGDGGGVKVIDVIAEGAKLTLGNGVSSWRTIKVSTGQLVVPKQRLEWRAGHKAALCFRDPHTADANRARFYEASAWVYSTTPADIDDVTAPTGTVSDTMLPAISITVEQVVEDWQAPTDAPAFCCSVSVELSIYAGHLAAPTGDPVTLWTEEVDVDDYIDGSTPSQETLVTAPPSELENGEYTLFVRVSREHPTGVPAWSAYGSTQWEQDVALPPPPGLELATDTAGQRITGTMTVYTEVGYDAESCRVHVQRLVGGLWRDVRGLAAAPLVADDSPHAIMTDYECDRSIDNSYRARASMVMSGDGSRRYSEWTHEAVAGPAMIGSGWNLVPVQAPGLAWLGAPVLVAPEEESQQDTAVFYALGRRLPIAVSGASGGMSGTYSVLARGAGDIARLEQLRDADGAIYVASAFGDTKHIALTGVSWEREGTTDAPRRLVELAYIEVGSGLATSAT